MLLCIKNRPDFSIVNAGREVIKKQILAARKGTEGAEMCVVKTITRTDQLAPRLVIPPFKRKVHTI